jgi:hypothetical protein
VIKLVSSHVYRRLATAMDCPDRGEVCQWSDRLPLALSQERRDWIGFGAEMVIAWI